MEVHPHLTFFKMIGGTDQSDPHNNEQDQEEFG